MFSLDFHRMSFGGGGDQFTGDGNTGPGSDPFQKSLVHRIQVDHRLNSLKGGSIVDGNKLVVTEGAHPAHNGNGLPCRRCGKQCFDLYPVHGPQKTGIWDFNPSRIYRIEEFTESMVTFS